MSVNSTTAIILANECEEGLNELVKYRAVASLPFGGRYRLVDFILSSMVGSGIDRIGIVTERNYNSLLDHLGRGKDWDIGRKRDGISVFPPFHDLLSNKSHFAGKIEALASVLPFVSPSGDEYVLVSNANLICNINFEKFSEFHEAQQADITVVAAHISADGAESLCLTAENGRVTAMRCTRMPPEKDELVSLNIYYMRKTLFIRSIEDCLSHGLYNFENDILQKSLREGLRVCCCEHTGYCAFITGVASYFHHSMQLLSQPVRSALFEGCNTIFTKIKDSPPTFYGENAVVRGSFIADGCEIDGEVENSIIFRSVTVGRGAIVKNSILMQNTAVLPDAKLNYVITDKNVRVGSERLITGFETFPVVIPKNASV